MKFLLYCIFHSPVYASFGAAESRKYQKLGIHSGLGGQPVYILSRNGLSAAVSNIAPSDLNPDIPRILIYKKVIESFHSDHTIIPMRYGCVFDEKSQITGLLKEREKQYKALLKELDGCEEIGIRILLEKDQCEKMYAQTDIHNSATSLRTYLAARKAYYNQEELFAKEIRIVIESCHEVFAGLFVKCKEEYHTIRNISLPSLYFLVPRSSVESFRRVFRNISFNKSTKLLLSGPWPPYNFVLPVHSQNQSPVCTESREKTVDREQKGGLINET